MEDRIPAGECGSPNVDAGTQGGRKVEIENLAGGKQQAVCDKQRPVWVLRADQGTPAGEKTGQNAAAAFSVGAVDVDQASSTGGCTSWAK